MWEIMVQCPSTSVFGTYHTVSDMIVIAVVNVFAKIKTRPRHWTEVITCLILLSIGE